MELFEPFTARRLGMQRPKYARRAENREFLTRGQIAQRLLEGFGIFNLGARNCEMWVDLAADMALSRGKFIRCASNNRGWLRNSSNGRSTASPVTLANSFARTRIWGGVLSSGVRNNLELGLDAFEVSIAIGIESSRPRMTGVIQSSNGNETA